MLSQSSHPTGRNGWKQDILCNVRTPFKEYRIIAALAAILILSLNVVCTWYNEAALASYIASSVAFLPSYATSQVVNNRLTATGKVCTELVNSSYNLAMNLKDASYICCWFSGVIFYNDGNTAKRKQKNRHWVEKHNGGNGLAIACYVRVSSAHQANDGFSVDAQIAKLRKMIESVNLSTVYWFVDAGMTGTKFDNRAVVQIMGLKKQGKIAELWVSEIDRIGRDAPKLIMFFFNFCEDGGRIRTPEAAYDNSHDLSAFIILAVKAFAAQDSNQSRRRASMDGKAESFGRKHWNKRVPTGFEQGGEWIQKLQSWDQAIKDIYALCIAQKSDAENAAEFNRKYGQKLNTQLKPSQTHAILTDPVYVGRPEHLGVVVKDNALAFVDEETFSKCQEIINKRNCKKEARPLDIFQELLATKHVWALHFVEAVVIFVHRNCGGAIVKNGTVKYENIGQQLFLCRRCRAQWRVPSLSQIKELHRGPFGEADLLDDARDLLREAIEKKKADSKERRRLRQNGQQLNQSQSLEPWWMTPVRSIQPSSAESINQGPNYGRLFEWLFQ